MQGAIGKGPRYAVYDFEYSLASGEGERLVWCASMTPPELHG